MRTLNFWMNVCADAHVNGCVNVHVWPQIPFHYLLLCQYTDDFTAIIEVHM